MLMQIDLAELHYNELGEGRAVLLLHGWGGSGESFAPVSRRLAELGMRAVSIDFPGFGKSPAPDASWSLDDYARTTYAFIREKHLEGCDVVAHSFGGRVVIKLAAKYPELFRRIVLCDSAGIKPRRTLKARARVLAYKAGKALMKFPWAKRTLKLDERMRSAGSADYRALSDDMKKVFVRVVNEDLTGLLPHIRQPTLLIWGENDHDTPLYMARIMEKRIPDAGLVVFEGAGHFAYLDQFARFMTVIGRFLEGD